MTPHVARANPESRRTYVAILVPVLSLAGVWFVSPFAFFTTLIEMAAVLVLAVPALLLGRALLRLFRFSAMPARWTVVLSAALGSGSLSLLMLGLGLAGFLQRDLWFAVLAVVSLIGLYVWWSETTHRQELPPRVENARSAWTALWILAVPFLTLAFLAASNAPGLIWQEEGFGYDILEYHLQLPKEYRQNGSITYIPHNVYCNFPANVEMLYLLSMIVDNDVRDIGTTANMIHLLFAALCVLTVWAIGCDISSRAGIVGGVVVATCTWLEYLSGLAYVENGMLFFGLAALGAALHTVGPDVTRSEQWKWTALAGILAGFASGCKYTAVPMILIPLAIVWFISDLAWKRKMLAIAVYLSAALLAFSPWLIKNATFTGNPVFPLANSLFDATPPGWSEAQSLQWARAHGPESGTSASMAVMLAAWKQIPGDHAQRFGPTILGLGMLGLWRRPRDRIDAALAAIAATQLAVWLLGTHQYARFAVPLLIPLAVLAARSLSRATTALRTSLIALLLICGALWNVAFAISRHERETAYGAPASMVYEGMMPGFEYLGFVNKELPDDARLLLVGEARPYYVFPDNSYYVVFNQNPFFALVAMHQDSEQIIAWLRVHGYTHVLVNWSEIRRLERSYGFNPPITEAQLGEVMAKLTQKEIKLVKAFAHPAHATIRYVDLFQVPAASGEKH